MAIQQPLCPITKSRKEWCIEWYCTYLPLTGWKGAVKSSRLGALLWRPTASHSASFYSVLPFPHILCHICLTVHKWILGLTLDHVFCCPRDAAAQVFNSPLWLFWEQSALAQRSYQGRESLGYLRTEFGSPLSLLESVRCMQPVFQGFSLSPASTCTVLICFNSVDFRIVMNCFLFIFIYISIFILPFNLERHPREITVLWITIKYQ